MQLALCQVDGLVDNPWRRLLQKIDQSLGNL
jgi:hypothetical protein